MRMILVIGLSTLSLIACKETDGLKAQGGDIPLTNVNAGLPHLGNTNIPITKSPEPILTNVNAPTFKVTRTNPTQPSFLPNGSYTAASQPYCVGPDCSYDTLPQGCNLLFPGDFTVYADDNATFWDSIPESVEFDLESAGVLSQNNVLLLSQTTNHQGHYFNYQYLGNKVWQVNFTPTCGRVYICHVGDCLE